MDFQFEMEGVFAYLLPFVLYKTFIPYFLALKKSQKEANVLVQRSLRSQGIEQHHGQGNTNRISKLESDLMGQWRSLFLHMEDIFGRENSQLVSITFVPHAPLLFLQVEFLLLKGTIRVTITLLQF